jgi:hypothetical protein
MKPMYFFGIMHVVLLCLVWSGLLDDYSAVVLKLLYTFNSIALIAILFSN